MDTIVSAEGGEALTGTLQHDSFTVVTDIGNIKIPKENIAQVLINVAAHGGKDEVFTYSSLFIGDLVEDPIKMKLEDSGNVVQVPQNKIVAIFVG